MGVSREEIVRDAPYDRANTSMAAFDMCEACRREYDSALGRRFHAQPNACPAGAGDHHLGSHRVRRPRAIRAGLIVALRPRRVPPCV